MSGTLVITVFNESVKKDLCRQSQNPPMLHIKNDEDWPTGLRANSSRKCGQ